MRGRQPELSGKRAFANFLIALKSGAVSQLQLEFPAETSAFTPTDI